MSIIVRTLALSQISPFALQCVLYSILFYTIPSFTIHSVSVLFAFQLWNITSNSKHLRHQPIPLIILRLRLPVAGGLRSTSVQLLIKLNSAPSLYEFDTTATAHNNNHVFIMNNDKFAFRMFTHF